MNMNSERGCYLIHTLESPERNSNVGLSLGFWECGNFLSLARICEAKPRSQMCNCLAGIVLFLKILQLLVKTSAISRHWMDFFFNTIAKVLICIQSLILSRKVKEKQIAR